MSARRMSTNEARRANVGGHPAVLNVASIRRFEGRPAQRSCQSFGVVQRTESAQCTASARQPRTQCRDHVRPASISNQAGTAPLGLIIEIRRDPASAGGRRSQRAGSWFAGCLQVDESALPGGAAFMRMGSAWVPEMVSCCSTFRASSKPVKLLVVLIRLRVEKSAVAADRAAGGGRYACWRINKTDRAGPRAEAAEIGPVTC